MYLESHERLGPAPRDTVRLALVTVSTAQFSVAVTRLPAEVREAQELRYQVFSQEMGADLGSHPFGIDEDVYDQHCDHLIVRDNATSQVVGTYRILPPHAARHLGFYSDTEFETQRLAALKSTLCEFGRSCVHPDYRSGPVIMQLWAGLAQYMVKRGYEHVIGCASVSMRDGGHQAASLYARLKDLYRAPAEYAVTPRNPLPLAGLNQDLVVEAPPLIKGYLRVGARICGEPAWDPAFNTADFFMLLSLARMNPRYARHFGIPLAGQAG